MATAVDYRPDFASRVTHITQVMSQSAFADLVGVSRSSVSRWRDGADTPSEGHAALVLDVDYILGQYAQHYPAARFREWFTSANAFLNGARPHDVLLVEGPTRVIQALHAEAAGSFA